MENYEKIAGKAMSRSSVIVVMVIGVLWVGTALGGGTYRQTGADCTQMVVAPDRICDFPVIPRATCYMPVTPGRRCVMPAVPKRMCAEPVIPGRIHAVTVVPACLPAMPVIPERICAAPVVPDRCRTVWNQPKWKCCR